RGIAGVGRRYLNSRDEGQGMRCPGISEDETGRLRGSKRLEASAATSPNAIITFDANARITAWNKGAIDMFERTEDEALGEPIDLLVAETDRMQVRACIARVLAGGAPGDDGTELAAVRSSGTVFPVEIHWSRWEEAGEMHFGA